MWSCTPFDVLSKIFSYLSPDSLASASSTCKHWHICFKSYPLNSATNKPQHPPWFLAMSTRSISSCCYAHDMDRDRWHSLPLDFLTDPVRAISAIGSFILCRQSASSTPLQLGLCNPFTKQLKLLPPLTTLRINPAIGVVFGTRDKKGTFEDENQFRIYVAGGMGEGPKGGASYEPTLEVYESVKNKWESVGWMPVELAVRLTVWTPNESVYSQGALYWITSARAYSVMCLEIESKQWKEVKVPMADKLEFASLVRRKERVVLVGGTSEGEVCLWELVVKEANWVLIERVPSELGQRFLGSWCSTKCVGSGEAVYLYGGELGTGMLVWRAVLESGGKWEWFWVDGWCSSIRGVPSFPIKGLLIYPSLN
ncbi:hypothetical protein Syun_011067 [Stephania yunnanensis]|uniref:F-box domain-containing protein n=1 Tax=Stephania yunnanensis TaxID=152371 RepID=A0AAP0PF27_9MAGN